MIKVVIVLGAALLVVSAYSVYATKQWGAERQANKQLIEDLRSERNKIRVLEKNLDNSNRLVAEAEAEKSALRKERAATQQEFRENVENDPEARAWRDTPLPAVVLDGL